VISGPNTTRLFLHEGQKQSHTFTFFFCAMPVSCFCHLGLVFFHWSYSTPGPFFFWFAEGPQFFFVVIASPPPPQTTPARNGVAGGFFFCIFPIVTVYCLFPFKKLGCYVLLFTPPFKMNGCFLCTTSPFPPISTDFFRWVHPLRVHRPLSPLPNSFSPPLPQCHDHLSPPKAFWPLRDKPLTSPPQGLAFFGLALIPLEDVSLPLFRGQDPFRQDDMPLFRKTPLPFLLYTYFSPVNLSGGTLSRLIRTVFFSPPQVGRDPTFSTFLFFSHQFTVFPNPLFLIPPLKKDDDPSFLGSLIIFPPQCGDGDLILFLFFIPFNR